MRFTGLISRSRAAQSPSASKIGRWIEAALLIVLAFQVARLVWALFASTGPYGDWRARQPIVPAPQARQALFAAFDPFYRLAAGADGVQQVTSLPLQLFGIRLNEGSGLGSAIIADESGEQRSYAVGDEIAPGVTLASVSYDHVTISRGGVSETLYIDQSGAAPMVGEDVEGEASAEAPNGLPNAPPLSGEAFAPDALLSGIGFAPRLENGEVTGIAVSPQGGSGVFARVGFRPGDVIAQINGSGVRSAEDIAALRSTLTPGASLTLIIERGGTRVPIALTIPDKK